MYGTDDGGVVCQYKVILSKSPVFWFLGYRTFALYTIAIGKIHMPMKSFKILG